MDILFKNELIGNMSNTYNEEYWVHGDFTPYSAYYKYKNFFDALVCEEGMDETQFDRDLLDENNWFVKADEGIIGIWMPAIYEDGDVSIRYR